MSPDKWVPTPPTLAPPLEPHWGTLRPFALEAPESYAPDPPIPYDDHMGSEFYLQAFRTCQATKKLTAEQFKQYAADPLATDEKVRAWCSVPEDRYYTVATWPKERAGELRVTSELHRVVRAPKISKSNQAQTAS